MGVADGVTPTTGNDVLAAMMSFLWRDTISIYYIGVAEDANRECSATNFLTTSVAEWAVERGLRYYDWGRSRKDSGAFQFKKNQGAQPSDLHYQFQLVRSEGLRTNYVHELDAGGLRSTEGEPLLHEKAYYTLIRRPASGDAR